MTIHNIRFENNNTTAIVEVDSVPYIYEVSTNVIAWVNKYATYFPNDWIKVAW
jgi:hypothetical protein